MCVCVGLCGAPAAVASSFNDYTGSQLAISPSGSALGMTETLVVNAPSGDRPAPLTGIEYTIYGVNLDSDQLPVCTDALIEQNKTSPTGNCPEGSLIGTGTVDALLGPGNDPSASKGTPCNVYANVFNGGSNTQVFYLYTKSASDCAGLGTGSIAPFDGQISYSGGTAIVNFPLPPDVSTMVAGQPGFYASITREDITYSATVDGKVYMANAGCQGGQRPWSLTFTAQNYDGTSDQQTVAGSGGCSTPPPTAVIASPSSGGTYAVGQSVPTSFSCAEGTGGPGLSSCLDSNGASAGSGHLDTTIAGPHSYAVSATSRDGQTATKFITYAVIRGSSLHLVGSPTFTGNRLRFKLKCSAPTGQSCQTTDVLTTTETLTGGLPVAVTAAHKAKKLKHTVVVARERTTITGGRTQTITLTLNPTGRKLLKRFHKLPVRLTIKLAKNGRLTVALTRKVTIKPKNGKHVRALGPLL
jgi:hypothetical protein